MGEVGGRDEIMEGGGIVASVDRSEVLFLS